jgi:hypothetical protein
MRNVYKVLVVDLMGREHLEDIYVDGRITLNISCINHVGGFGLEL